MIGVVIALGIIFLVFIISTLYEHSDTIASTLESVEVKSCCPQNPHLHNCDFVPEGERHMGVTPLEYVRRTAIDK